MVSGHVRYTRKEMILIAYSKQFVSCQRFFFDTLLCFYIFLNFQETVSKGVDLCHICRRKYGVCIKVKVFSFVNFCLKLK